MIIVPSVNLSTENIMEIITQQSISYLWVAIIIGVLYGYRI